MLESFAGFVVLSSNTTFRPLGDREEHNGESARDPFSLHFARSRMQFLFRACFRQDFEALAVQASSASRAHFTRLSLAVRTNTASSKSTGWPRCVDLQGGGAAKPPCHGAAH